MTFAEVAIATVALGALLVGVLFRHSLRAHLRQPVAFTVGHIALGGLLMGLLLGSVVYVSHLNRVELGKERQARVDEAFRSLQSQILTRTQVAAIGERLISLATPTNAERNRRNLVALKSCVMSEQCRRLLTTIVVRTLRVETPVKGATNTRTIVIQGKRGPAGPAGAQGPQGLPGTSGHDGGTGGNGKDGSVDSGLLDGIDNRLSDLERGLGSILAQVPGIQRIVGLLCKALPVCR